MPKEYIEREALIARYDAERVSDEHGAKIYCFGLLFVLECNLGQL